MERQEGVQDYRLDTGDQIEGEEVWEWEAKYLEEAGPEFQEYSCCMLDLSNINKFMINDKFELVLSQLLC